MAGREFLSTTWAEAGPIADDEGVYVQLPKQNSAAVKAGLRRGDVILAAGGQEIESYGDLQSAVRNGEPGEEIRLTVRRGPDELEEVAVVHP
jgi:S1-C subfamily serine protease